MRFKSEFSRRLQRLYCALDKSFLLDGSDKAEKPSDLFPSLFSVLSYLWSHSFKIYK